MSDQEYYYTKLLYKNLDPSHVWHEAATLCSKLPLHCRHYTSTPEEPPKTQLILAAVT